MEQNVLKNNKAYALLLTILILGSVSLLLFFLIRDRVDQFNNFQSHMTQIQNKKQFFHKIKKVLESENACKNSFKGVDLSDESLVIKEIKDDKDQILFKKNYQIGKDIFFKKVVLEIGSGEEKKEFISDLKIDLEKNNQVLSQKFPIYVVFDFSSKKLIKCSSSLPAVHSLKCEKIQSIIKACCRYEYQFSLPEGNLEQQITIKGENPMIIGSMNDQTEDDLKKDCEGIPSQAEIKAVCFSSGWNYILSCKEGEK